MSKFNDELFLQSCLQKLNVIFDSKIRESFHLKIRIIQSIVKECFKQNKYGKVFLNIIKTFFKVFYN